MMALIEFEGVALVPYQDSARVWTIGVGHTLSAGPPNPHGHAKISLGEALAILKADLVRFEHRVANAVGVPLKQWEFDALVSFDFNTGAIGSATLVKQLNRGERALAADGLLKWCNASIAGQKVSLPGLLARRHAERALFLMGEYGEPFIARVYETWPSKGVLRNLAGLML